MSSRTWFPFLASLCLALGACDSSADPPKRIHIVSKRLVDGEIALAKGESVLLGFDAFDADGKPFTPDPDCVIWTSDESKAIALEPRIPSAQAFAFADWFDAEPMAQDDAGAEPDAGMADAAVPMMPYAREPEARITAHACGAADSIVIRSVVRIAGTWVVTVGNSIVQTVTLKQNGRRIVAVAAEGLEEDVGEVRDDTVAFKLMGFDLRGRLTSEGSAAGSIQGVPSPEGDWKAIKQASTSIHAP